MPARMEKQFTGRHMLAIMVAFFGVIIAVNVTMAIIARQSWTGLVVQNSYVASQEFNQKMAETREQASLGWSSFVSFSDGRIRYRINDRTGHPVGLESVAVKFMRPVDDREDRRMMLALDQSGDFVADEAVADGVWLIEIEADAGMKKPFRETLRLRVAQGERQ